MEKYFNIHLSYEMKIRTVLTTCEDVKKKQKQSFKRYHQPLHKKKLHKFALMKYK